MKTKKLRAHNLKPVQIPQLFSGTTVLTQDHVRFLLQPCVYKFMRDDEVLYVGSSRTGVMRALCKNHSAKKARDEADRIVIDWYPTEKLARKAEAREIVTHKPPYNVAYPPNSRKRLGLESCAQKEI